LPDVLIGLIDTKVLSMGQARAPRTTRGGAGLSVRETETLVRKAQKGEGSATTVKRPELSVLSEVLRTEAAHVQLHQKSAGSGMIVEFADAESRDVIVDAIKLSIHDRLTRE
jgi:hypothetical protein